MLVKAIFERTPDRHEQFPSLKKIVKKSLI